MYLGKYRWLAYASVAIAAWIGLVQASASAWDADAAPAALENNGRSTLDVITHKGSANEAAQERASAAATAKSADQPANKQTPSKEPTSGQPARSVQTPEVPSESRAKTAESTTKEPAASADATADPSRNVDKPLKPIPDPRSSGLVPTETASFNGITPGVTTLEELQDAWGPPKEIANRNAQLMHLYSVEPFDRVEVCFVKDKVSAIVIRLDRSFPAEMVAEKLELSGVRPVLVSDELGHVLGESFPERGVLFSFEAAETPGRASMKVEQIILEPVSPEAFVLRAETHLDDQPELSLSDLEEAIKLDPKHPRAHWLRARLLAERGDARAALEACDEAIHLDPADAQFRLTRAQILGQTDRFTEAIQEAERALSASATRPHVKAQVLCLLGDLLSSQPKPDYRKAIEYHMEAVKTADPLAVSKHPAVRIAAKEVLVDAHLGAGHDIAWGAWDEKEKAVPRWLSQAATVAKDMIATEGASSEVEFRVATRALAALVGMRGKLDPAPWTERALRVGQELIASTPDPAHRDRIRWDLGMALYDVVQIYQMRGENDNALAYGKRAIGYLEPSAQSAQASLADTYLLGRLYFRLGAIHALSQEDHTAAIYWFEKAIPAFEQSVDHVAQAEFGRLGETYVSMGVSFWETGQQERAIRLSQRGVELMEQAVKVGAMDPSSLQVPYTNLATMAQHLGKKDEADRYLLEANKHKDTALR